MSLTRIRRREVIGREWQTVDRPTSAEFRHMVDIHAGRTRRLLRAELAALESGMRPGIRENSALKVRPSKTLMLQPSKIQDVQNVARLVEKSVVQVVCIDQNGQRWSGSGVIVDPAEMFPGIPFSRNDEPGVHTYIILTNHHVIPPGSTKKAFVKAFGDVVLSARVLQSPVNRANVQDGITDCGILVVKTTAELKTVSIAEKLPETGEVVIAAGHPINLPRPSFTAGIVSQQQQETGEAIPVIQHDAEINPGNSGGPLFNMNGEIVGINTFSFQDTNGLSFAIPTTEQRRVLNTILTKGEYIRGYFGFAVGDLSPFERDESIPPNMPASEITWVDKGSEADKAGLMIGDIVSTIVCSDGAKFAVNIDNPFEVTLFLQWMHERRPGSRIQMSVFRKTGGGDYQQATVTLTVDRLPAERKTLTSAAWGFTLQKERNGLFVISDVVPGSPAAVRGFRGDGRWALLGVRIRGVFDDKPIPINDLELLKMILIALNEAGATEIDLVVADTRNPKTGAQIVTLQRRMAGRPMDSDRIHRRLASLISHNSLLAAVRDHRRDRRHSVYRAG